MWILFIILYCAYLVFEKLYNISTNQDSTILRAEIKKLKQQEKKIGVNMDVVLFMADALKYFKDQPIDQIKSIALEIATQGAQGFSPEKKNYRISEIPGKVFSGYHIMAYYYVSWAITMPEVVGSLGLEFDREYKIAKGMINL